MSLQYRQTEANMVALKLSQIFNKDHLAPKEREQNKDALSVFAHSLGVFGNAYTYVWANDISISDNAKMIELLSKYGIKVTSIQNEPYPHTNLLRTRVHITAVKN